MEKSVRLIIFATHPIQYQVPLYQELSKRISLLVVYSLKQDAKGQANAGFGVQFDWDIPLLQGYEYTYLENFSKDPSSSSFRGIVINPREVHRIVQEFNPTHAIINGWFPKALQQIKRVLQNNPSIHVLCRGDSTLMMTHNSLKRLLKKIYIPWVLKGIDTFLYVGKANKAFYKFYGTPEKKLKPAHHCINTPLFEKLVGDRNNMVKDIFRLGFVGKLIGKKDPMLLLEAIALCKNKNRIHLVVIGDGPLRGALEQRAKELNVVTDFQGFMNQRQVATECYGHFDCLVLPSKENETWGLVVNEAMTQGVPCIVSDRVGCHLDLIVPGETGWVFEAEKADDLAAKIEKAFAKRANGAMQAMMVATRSHISQYSLKQTTKQILSALDTRY